MPRSAAAAARCSAAASKAAFARTFDGLCSYGMLGGRLQSGLRSHLRLLSSLRIACRPLPRLGDSQPSVFAGLGIVVVDVVHIPGYGPT